MKNKFIRSFLTLLTICTVAMGINYNFKKPEQKNIINENLLSSIPEKKEFNYDKYYIYPDVRAYANVTNKELYKKLYDSLDAVEGSVDISSYNENEEELKANINALSSLITKQFFYIRDITVSDDKSKINFTYMCSKEKILEMKKELSDKVTYIMDNILKPQKTDIQKTLALYKYIGENTSYNDEEKDITDGIGAYAILVNKKGICYEYANTFEYLLNMVGVECTKATSKEPNHMWNIVKLNNEYYHLDATFQGGEGLKFFAMSDDERNKTGEFNYKWYCGNDNFKIIEPPKCINQAYSIFENASDFDLDNEYIYFVDSFDSKIYKVDFQGNKKETVIDNANLISIYKDHIYYVNTKDDFKLYRALKDGSKAEKVSDDLGISKIHISGNNLNYDCVNEKGIESSKTILLK